MDNEILLVLAARLDREAVEPECQDGAEEAQIANAVRKGERIAKAQIARTLRALVAMLG